MRKGFKAPLSHGEEKWSTSALRLLKCYSLSIKTVFETLHTRLIIGNQSAYQSTLQFSLEIGFWVILNKLSLFIVHRLMNQWFFESSIAFFPSWPHQANTDWNSNNESNFIFFRLKLEHIRMKKDVWALHGSDVM